MANPARYTTLKARPAIVLATALAVLPPLPALCAACSTEASCSNCASANDSTATNRHSARPCCQDYVSTLVAGSDLACFVQHASSHCSCGPPPAQRTLPQREELAPTHDLVGSLSCTNAHYAATDAHNIAAALAPADRPPPIPHRILHCSWLI